MSVKLFLKFVNSPVGPRTTHFWGPIGNWGFVIQGFLERNRPPMKISKNMQVALVMQSALFMRFALVVNPRNLMLFTMHGANVILQSKLLFRRLAYDRNPSAYHKAPLLKQLPMLHKDEKVKQDCCPAEDMARE